MPTLPPGVSLRLGQEVFLVHIDGNITRSVVSDIGRNLLPMERLDPTLDKAINYSFLDYPTGVTDFFEFAPACDEAERRLKARIESGHSTKAEVKAAEFLLEQVHKRGSFFVKLRNEPLRFRHSDEIVVKREDIPRTYFEVGQKVYAVVGPNSPYGLDTEWRPRPYFILETDVTRVSIDPRYNSWLQYDLGSHFRVEATRIFVHQGEARRKLAEVFEKETGGTIALGRIQIISVMEEARAHKKDWERIGREVAARQAYADAHF